MCDVFLSVCIFVTLWNDKVCDNGNAMKQCNFQNNYGALHRGSFVFVHLYSAFSMDPLNFPLAENLYQKLSFFAIFEAVGPHFKTKTIKFGTQVRTPGTPSANPNFIKIT